MSIELLLAALLRRFAPSDFALAFCLRAFRAHEARKGQLCTGLTGGAIALKCFHLANRPATRTFQLALRG